MSESKKRYYIEITIALTTLMLLVLISMQSYILFPLIFLGAIIVSYIVYIGGIYFVLVSLVVSVLLMISITQNFILSVILAISYTLAGIIVAILLKQRKELKIILTATIISYMLPIITSIFFIDRVKKINIVDKYYFESMENILITFKKDLIAQMDNGFEFPFSINDIELQIKNIIYTLKILFPGMLIILLATISIIVIYSVINLLRRKGFEITEIPKFTQIKAPKSLILILGIVFFASGKNNIFSEAMLNMSYILYCFLIFFGISLMEFHFKRLRINLPFRILLYILVYFAFIPLQLFIPLLSPFRILIFLAIIDSFFDLRSLGKQSK